MDNNIEIGERIKVAREAANLTLNDVAQKVGVASSTIQRYETGKIKKIKLPVIHSISKVLQVDPMWILGKITTGLNPYFDATYTTPEGKTFAIEGKHQSKLPNTDFSNVHFKPHEGYYLDDEAAKIAQEIFENPDLRLLFDTAQKVDPDDLKLIARMVSKMVKEENGEEE